MRGIRLFFRFIQLFIGLGVLSCGFALPVIAAALFFSPRAAAGIAISLFIIPLALLLLVSEWGVLRLLNGQVPRTHGLRNSYEMAHAASGARLKSRPALVTFADPVPNVFVIRAIGGDGLILLSDGLIALLSEDELRFILNRAIQHLLTTESVLQGACVLSLALLQSRRSPKASMHDLVATAAYKRLLLYPWVRFFSGLAQSMVTRRVGQDASGRESSLEFVRGEFKLSRAGRLYGQQGALPGLVYLGIER